MPSQLGGAGIVYRGDLFERERRIRGISAASPDAIQRLQYWQRRLATLRCWRTGIRHRTILNTYWTSPVPFRAPDLDWALWEWRCLGAFFGSESGRFSSRPERGQRLQHVGSWPVLRPDHFRCACNLVGRGSRLRWAAKPRAVARPPRQPAPQPSRSDWLSHIGAGCWRQGKSDTRPRNERRYGGPGESLRYVPANG